MEARYSYYTPKNAEELAPNARPNISAGLFCACRLLPSKFRPDFTPWPVFQNRLPTYLFYLSHIVRSRSSTLRASLNEEPVDQV